jgi:DNA-binding MarR family transcriptional regulator
MKNSSLDATQCNCLSLRQAARHITQAYDRHFAPFGLTFNQFSILTRITQEAKSITDVARELVMDRTTLTRNLQPLQREGWLAQHPDPADGRSRLLSLTPVGTELMRRITPAWKAAQQQFETAFGVSQAAALRSTLQTVASLKMTG